MRQQHEAPNRIRLTEEARSSRQNRAVGTGPTRRCPISGLRLAWREQTRRDTGGLRGSSNIWYSIVMAIRGFSVENVRGLRNASYESLPDLVAIAGSNGVGKSTLLDQLFKRRNEFAEPATRVLYIGPNRSQRRAPVSAVGLFALQGDLVGSLSTEQQPSFSAYVPNDWRWSQGQPRGLDAPDESYALVKYEINKLESLRREALSQIHALHGSVPSGAMPDVFEPLRRLTTYLLPHLRFERVDQANTNDYRCIFSRTDGGRVVELDLDELSSGEKAIVALFMPFLSIQIKDRLADAGVTVTGHESNRSITALIDEPETHLHPILQADLVAYLRQLSAPGEVQFILATHSTTMLDAMNEDELFMLVPVDLAAGGNQFRRIVHADERLDTVRSLAGSMSVITRARPIVFMEGEGQASGTVSDQSLLGLLVPASQSWVVVPSRGRSEAIRHARQLQETLAQEIPGLPVFALVDHDQVPPDDETMVSWSVAMIENLLLDPGAMWDLLAPHEGRHSLRSEDDIAQMLLEIAQQRREDEIRLRVLRALGRVTLTPTMSGIESQLGVDIQAVETEFQQFIDGLRNNAAQAVSAAALEVDGILQDRTHLERFRGKQLVSDFYQQAHLGGVFPKQTFLVELARRAAEGTRLADLVLGPVTRIQRFVPQRLTELLDQARLNDQALQAARDGATAAIHAWQDPSLPPVDLDNLRSLVHRVVRAARDQGDRELADELAVLIPKFGLAR